MNPLVTLGKRLATYLTVPPKTLMAITWGAFGYKSPVQRNLNRFWTYYAENEVVFAGVQETVMASATVPFQTKRLRRGAYVNAPQTDVVQERLENPNHIQDAVAFRERMDTELCVTGNSIVAEWPADRSEILGEFTVLPTRNVYVTTDRRTGLIDQYYFDPVKAHGGPNVAFLNQPPKDALSFPPERIIHRTYAPDPWQYQWGLSPIAPAVEAIEADFQMTYYIREFFRRGAVPPYLFVSEASMTREQMRQMQRLWDDMNTGTGNGWTLGMLDGTKGTIEKLGLAAGSREVGLNDLRHTTEVRILMALNVPPIVVGAALGIENMTYSNYDQARMAMWEENTEPLIHKRSNAFTAYFRRRLSQPDLRIDGDFSGVMAVQKRWDERSERATRELQSGMTMRNEARTLVGLQPDQNGEVFYIPLNLTPERGSVVTAARIQALAGALEDHAESAIILREQALASALVFGSEIPPESIVATVMPSLARRNGDESKEQYARRILSRVHVMVRHYLTVGETEDRKEALVIGDGYN